MVLTDKEKRELALEVLRILREQSVGVNELPRVETMDGVCALPAYQTKDGVETAVVVPINLLGKPAIDAAAEAQEVITLAQDAINDANKATDSINASLEEVSQAADEALEAANSVNEAKTAATTAAEQAQKAADSAFRAADDADTVSSAVSEEWSGLKDEIIQATNAAGTGAGLAEEAVQKVNDFITEFEGKLMTDEEREKLLNTYTKSDTYNRQEVDEKNQDILDELNGKSDTGHSHSKSEITDFPASMPASDVPAWAKAASKPGYTASEVGAAPANHSHSADQISDTETKVMMTKAERSKLASFEVSSEIKKISNFYEANATGIYSVQGYAAGGPKFNDSNFASIGCLKVTENPAPPTSSDSPSIFLDYFLLKEFFVKRNDGAIFYFITFRGVTAEVNATWVQVFPALITTVAPPTGPDTTTPAEPSTPIPIT